MGGSSARSTIAVGGRLRRKWRNAPTQKGAPGGPSVRGANGGGSCACRGALTCIYGMLVFGVGRRRLPFIEHLLPGGVGGALAVRLDVSLRYSCGTETPSVRFMMMTTEAPPEGGLSREKSLWATAGKGTRTKAAQQATRRQRVRSAGLFFSFEKKIDRKKTDPKRMGWPTENRGEGSVCERRTPTKMGVHLLYAFLAPQITRPRWTQRKYTATRLDKFFDFLQKKRDTAGCHKPFF